MMKKYAFISTLLISSLGFSAPMAAKSFDFEKDGKFKIEIPQGWTDLKYHLGIPLALIGPTTEGFRPVINIIPTGVDDLKFDFKEMSKAQGTYKEGREQWVKSMNGTSLKYFPFAKETVPGVTEAYSVGMAYQVAQNQFVEKSYFIFCGKKLFHIQSLMNKAQAVTYESLLTKTVRSFQCETN